MLEEKYGKYFPVYTDRIKKSFSSEYKNEYLGNWASKSDINKKYQHTIYYDDKKFPIEKENYKIARSILYNKSYAILYKSHKSQYVRDICSYVLKNL